MIRFPPVWSDKKTFLILLKVNNHDVVPLYCMLTTREALLQYDHKASFFIIMIIITKASPRYNVYLFVWSRGVLLVWKQCYFRIFRLLRSGAGPYLIIEPLQRITTWQFAVELGTLPKQTVVPLTKPALGSGYRESGVTADTNSNCLTRALPRWVWHFSNANFFSILTLIFSVLFQKKRWKYFF